MNLIRICGAKRHSMRAHDLQELDKDCESTPRVRRSQVSHKRKGGLVNVHRGLHSSEAMDDCFKGLQNFGLREFAKEPNQLRNACLNLSPIFRGMCVNKSIA